MSRPASTVGRTSSEPVSATAALPCLPLSSRLASTPRPRLLTSAMVTPGPPCSVSSRPAPASSVHQSVAVVARPQLVATTGHNHLASLLASLLAQPGAPLQHVPALARPRFKPPWLASPSRPSGASTLLPCRASAD
ncbi:hypothetical protein ZWY2020_035716 [Hordeum vulgare]|nr:hypothetical protein ZWY2020_035716 [Hordeum vulgare]